VCREVCYPRVKRERPIVPTRFADSQIGYFDSEFIPNTSQDGFVYDRAPDWFPGVSDPDDRSFNPYPLFPIEDFQIPGLDDSDVANLVIGRKADYSWLELRLKFDIPTDIQRFRNNESYNANYRVVVFHWNPQVTIRNGQRPDSSTVPVGWFPEELFSSFALDTARARNILTQVNPTYRDQCTVLFDEYFKFSADYSVPSVETDEPSVLYIHGGDVALTSQDDGTVPGGSIYAPPPPAALGWVTTDPSRATVGNLGSMKAYVARPAVQLIGDFGVHTRRIDLKGLSSSTLFGSRSQPGTSNFQLSQQGGLWMLRIRDIRNPMVKLSVTSRVAFTDSE